MVITNYGTRKNKILLSAMWYLKNNRICNNKLHRRRNAFVILLYHSVWISLHTGFWMSFRTSDVSSPRISKYEMIFMACWRSSLALSKNILAKPGRFTVSREKWAPWNKTKKKNPSYVYSLQNLSSHYFLPVMSMPFLHWHHLNKLSTFNRNKFF
jgi:hypothetical protein